MSPGDDLDGWHIDSDWRWIGYLDHCYYQSCKLDGLRLILEDDDRLSKPQRLSETSLLLNGGLIANEIDDPYQRKGGHEL